MNQKFLEQLTEILPEEQIYKDEPMSRHTTFRIGGKADVLVMPTLDQIANVMELCNEHQVPVTMIEIGRAHV